MPVRKFRTFDEASDALAMDRDDPQLARRLAWVLSMGAGLEPESRVGVRKYRSLEEAHAERERLQGDPQSPTRHE